MMLAQQVDECYKKLEALAAEGHVLDDSMFDDLVIVLHNMSASALNNQGFIGQITYILEQLGGPDGVANITKILDALPPIIHAEAHSDDYNVEVRFDATAWFRQATGDEIVALADCGWGGDYPADEVARKLSKTIAPLYLLFNYVEAHPASASNDAVGFECHVDEADARRWLGVNNPHLLAAILAKE
jgi:hypothetical protein